MRTSLKSFATLAFASYLSGCTSLYNAPDDITPSEPINKPKSIVVGSGDMALKMKSIMPKSKIEVYADPVYGVSQNEFDMVVKWYGEISKTLRIASLYHVAKPNVYPLAEQYDHQYILSELEPEKDYTEEEIYDVIANTANDILQGLDVHSSYQKPADHSNLMNMIKGEALGVGIAFSLAPEGVKIEAINETGPAFKAGIKEGDILTSDGAVSFTDIKDTKVFLDHIDNNAEYNFSVLRDGKLLPETFNFSQDVVEYDSVFARVLNGEIAQFYVTNFADDAHIQLREKFKAVMDKFGSDIKGIVLDVRDNFGGDINAADGIVNDFTKENDLFFVYAAEGQNIVKITYYDETGGTIMTDLPMTVLINQNSASASEIVAGALQERERATIIGDSPSHGKATMQGVVPHTLPNGKTASIKLTNGIITLPVSNTSYQAIGIQPDILVPMNDDKKAALAKHEGPIYEKDHENHLPNPHENKVAEPSPYNCDINVEGKALVNIFNMKRNTEREVTLNDKVLLCAIDHLSETPKYTLTVKNEPGV